MKQINKIKEAKAKRLVKSMGLDDTFDRISLNKSGCMILLYSSAFKFSAFIRLKVGDQVVPNKTIQDQVDSINKKFYKDFDKTITGWDFI